MTKPNLEQLISEAKDASELWDNELEHKMLAALVHIQRFGHVRPNDGSHWEGCWDAGGHHICAVNEIEQLNKSMATLTTERDYWHNRWSKDTGTQAIRKK